MKITTEQLEALFYGDNTLKDVIPALKEELDRADYYRTVFINNLVDNTEELKRALYEITGLFDLAVKAYEMAEAALDVQEPDADYRIRVADEKVEGDAKTAKKKTDANVKALAAREVAQYRRVRGYLLGYVRGLDACKGTLQSVLKFEGSPKGARNSNQQEP